MRVIHLNLERGWRGGEHQVFLLVRELAGLSVEQTVIGRNGELLLERLKTINGIRLIGAGGRVRALWKMRAEPRPAIIHAHTGNTVALAVLGKRLGDALVATRRMDLPASSFWLNRMDKVAAISGSVEASLRESGIEDKMIVRIPSGIDRGRIIDHVARSLVRKELGIPEDTVLGLTVAALEMEKGPFTLARAFKYLPAEYHHLWVGNGSLKNEMEGLIRIEGIANRFHLTGFVRDPDPYYAAADLFILPSIHEGLGTVLLDAFHFGLPVVGSRIAGTADLLEDGETALLFSTCNKRGLAEAAVRILNNPDLGRALVKGGKDRLAGYDIKTTARSYLDLYNDILSS